MRDEFIDSGQRLFNLFGLSHPGFDVQANLSVHLDRARLLANTGLKFLAPGFGCSFVEFKNKIDARPGLYKRKPLGIQTNNSVFSNIH